MTLWKRAAFAGFAVGVVMALVLLLVARIAAHGHVKIWVRVVDFSATLFPTYIFLLPLSDSESFPHDLFFYAAAIVGNGVAFSLVAQTVAGLYFVAARLLSK